MDPVDLPVFRSILFNQFLRIQINQFEFVIEQLGSLKLQFVIVDLNESLVCSDVRVNAGYTSAVNNKVREKLAQQ
ncbi:hypothetical protein BpHYR1_023021 [Brachionus plicatilis]|uniref:Uncharacterized protein n=1 Tax=Brachionus plicatilis TaxID=10195 RepID=A0A3M7RWN4_BRAPC|nr:hypothetical protein BpHYR1_023021 [Brachionus plicatilis]